MRGVNLDGAFNTFEYLRNLRSIAGFDLAVAISSKIVFKCDAEIKEFIKTATTNFKLIRREREFFCIS